MKELVTCHEEFPNVLNHLLKKDLLAILEGLPIPLMLVSTELYPQVLFLNRQFTANFGYTLGDIPTLERWMQWAFRGADNSKEPAALREVSAALINQCNGVSESGECTITSRDGSSKRWQVSVVMGEGYQQFAFTTPVEQSSNNTNLERISTDAQKAPYDITDQIPAGIYSMVLRPGDTLARFTFMSSRFLEICGLEREAAEADPLNAFACVHSDDRMEWIRKNTNAFEKKIPFSEEVRLCIDGEIRWVHAESIPYDLADGCVIWQGVIADISRRKKAELELASLREKDKQKEVAHRNWLERRLSISLASSALANTINPPLTRLLNLTSKELVRLRESLPATQCEEQMDLFKSMESDLRLLVDTIHQTSLHAPGSFLLARSCFKARSTHWLRW